MAVVIGNSEDIITDKKIKILYNEEIVEQYIKEHSEDKDGIDNYIENADISEYIIKYKKLTQDEKDTLREKFLDNVIGEILEYINKYLNKSIYFSKFINIDDYELRKQKLKEDLYYDLDKFLEEFENIDIEDNKKKNTIRDSLEDWKELNDNRPHKEYQNLPNVYNFISTMCAEQEDKTMLMDSYIETLPQNSPVVQQFAPARIAPSKTRASFFTSALATLNIFVDDYVASMIDEAEIDINKFNEEKSALFMILPDEKTTFYGLCSLFVNQAYTKLCELADSKGGRLNIRTNFILDEFGNFSAIPNFGGFLTVGGGRGIRFNLFIQSFSQLNDKYGDNTAKNILDNCHCWNYLKTSNFETAEMISKKIGTYTCSTWSTSNSSSGGAVNRSNSMNLSQRALLTTDEVLRIQRPALLVMVSGENPAITNSPDLHLWYFNETLGLGNPEWNTNIRDIREKSRKIKEIHPQKFWNIDKVTKERKSGKSSNRRNKSLFKDPLI